MQISDQQLRAAVESADGNLTIAARSVGLPRTTFTDRWDKIKPEADKADLRQRLEVDEDEKSKGITSVSSSLRSLNAVLSAAQVDLAIWEVERHVINKWDVAMKLKDGKGQHKPHAESLWQIKIWLRRKIPKLIEDAAKEFLERIRKHAPKYPRLIRPKHLDDPRILEVGLVDAHFGKLAWGEETGVNYDLKIAGSVYFNAAQDVLARTKHVNIFQIILPIGNDFFHTNNAEGTTARGTRQDTDGRSKKVFRAGKDAVIRAIEAFLVRAPVKVVWVPGNHDPDTSWYLCELLAAYFGRCDAVEIDTSPMSRKYIRFGNTLIGLAHGDEESWQSLPSIMASEERDAWAKAKYCEWHVGHFHKQKQIQYNAGDTFNSVVVRVLPSLSGTDAWHYRKGYVKTPRAAESYLWTKDRGLDSFLVSPVMEN